MKVCAMVGVWPADSHNIIESADITGDADAQGNALRSDAGYNPIWRYSVRCATIGKYPSVSIEGGSLTARNVYTSNTHFNNHLFGSWVEYDIAALSTNQKIGSGASLGYKDPMNQINGLGLGGNGDGLQEGTAIRNPQTLGNLDSSAGEGVGSSEIVSYINRSKVFANKISSEFFDRNGNLADSGMLRTGNYIGPDEKGFLFYRPMNYGDVIIHDNIINDSKNASLVIVASSVFIENDVDRIDATIIAYGDFDTCYGFEQNASDGNQDLLANCNRSLLINGAVYVEGQLRLDRTYGSGSFTPDGQLNMENLSQRAEIFNFDPRFVKTSYEYATSKKSYSETYIKELQTRF